MPAMDLSDDLMFEILSWLPPESLISLRPVCKLWSSTISDPKFMQLHRSHFGSTGNYGRIVIPRIAMGLGRHISNPVWLKFSVYPDINRTTPHDLEVVNNRMAHLSWTISGLCNGIIYCTSMWPNCNLSFLCNPCIGTMTLLPPCPLDRSIDFEYFPNAFGFSNGVGRDAIHDDFRVLKMRRHDSFREGEAAVFSIVSNSWKRVEGPIPDSNTMGASIFLNGFIHWLSFRPDSSLARNKFILVFDVTNEVFGEMQLPETPNNWRLPYYMASISTLKGLLCVKTVNVGRISSCEVWTMNEYGVTESWTKLYEVEVSDEVFHTMDVTVEGKIVMFCYHGWFARDGKLVFEKDENEGKDLNSNSVGQGQLVLYDPKMEVYSNVCRISTGTQYVSIEANLELFNRA